MYQVGHYGAALVAYAPVGTAIGLAGNETVAILGALVCVGLSTIPDVDHKLPLIDHRGPTHTVGFAVAVGTVLAAATAILVDATSPAADVGFVTFAFVVGTLSIGSHLLADALTPMGIRPFWPLSRRHYSLGVTTAANPIANYVLLAIGAGMALLGIGVVVTFG
ncbi:inner membrane protein [Natronorubrum sediminis]|uniref:Inner membrane protein n=1 Tax=Natronorubrum sediminis TaxID=640943 RepID=A0A1H6FV57_9EURY|nr:metal-dependent hydrolase [Natronorubrum sediminis]SEH14312.1 inner membrane protein [Natronorubrum sediminis]